MATRALRYMVSEVGRGVYTAEIRARILRAASPVQDSF